MIRTEYEREVEEKEVPQTQKKAQKDESPFQCGCFSLEDEIDKPDLFSSFPE